MGQVDGHFGVPGCRDMQRRVLDDELGLEPGGGNAAIGIDSEFKLSIRRSEVAGANR